MRMLLVLALAASACGEDQKCDPTDRTGAYHFGAVEIWGSCGPIESSVGILNEGRAVDGADCDVHYERWSEDQCSVERSVVCEFPGDNERVRMAGIWTQNDAEGKSLTGSMTMTITRLDNGGAICTSTYDVSATRL